MCARARVCVRVCECPSARTLMLILRVCAIKMFFRTRFCAIELLYMTCSRSSQRNEIAGDSAMIHPQGLEHKEPIRDSSDVFSVFGTKRTSGNSAMTSSQGFERNELTSDSAMTSSQRFVQN